MNFANHCKWYVRVQIQIFRERDELLLGGRAKYKILLANSSKSMTFVWHTQTVIIFQPKPLWPNVTTVSISWTNIVINEVAQALVSMMTSPQKQRKSKGKVSKLSLLLFLSKLSVIAVFNNLSFFGIRLKNWWVHTCSCLFYLLKSKFPNVSTAMQMFLQLHTMHIPFDYIAFCKPLEAINIV